MQDVIQHIASLSATIATLDAATLDLLHNPKCSESRGLSPDAVIIGLRNTEIYRSLWDLRERLAEERFAKEEELAAYEAAAAPTDVCTSFESSVPVETLYEEEMELRQIERADRNLWIVSHYGEAA